MKYCRDCELYECALRAPLGGCNLDMDNSTPYFNKGVSVVPQSQFDWQSFRREAAKDILCAIVRTESVMDDRNIDHCTKEEQVKDAIRYTDLLIKQLKGEK